MRSLKLPSIALAILVVTALWAVPTGEAEAALSNDQKCRADIDKASSRYFERTHRVRQRCMRRVFRGKLSLATDCIEGDGDTITSRRLQELRDLVARLLSNQCRSADFTALGYPGACQDTVPPANSFDSFDLEACLLDGHDAAIKHLLEMEYPPAQFLPGRFLRCVNGAARKSADMVRAEMRARQACLFQADLSPGAEDDAACMQELPPYGAGTGDARADKRILRGYVELLAGIPTVCNGLNTDVLGYTDHCEDHTAGRFNTFDLKLCLFDDHREMALESVEIAYPSDPVCGDGDPEGDEECDDGNDSNEDACTNECLVARCGDGFVQAGQEECDDGNSLNSDACVADCKLATCGDEFVQVGVEACDDGNSRDTDACRNDCSSAACGDGVVCTAQNCTTGPNGQEDCDDGNTVAGDGCDDECRTEFCGDGVINNGDNEECDDGPSMPDGTGNGTGPNQCRIITCKLPFCGDGTIDDAQPFDEECDPPDGSVCGDDCKPLNCGNGVVDPGEECDDGRDNNSDSTPNACRTNCMNPECGDGIFDDETEACEPIDGVNCLPGCVLPNCGNGVVQPEENEECDDGPNNSNTQPDACRENCKFASCGDGVTDTDEQCDDGRNGNGDACLDTCVFNECGDGFVNPAAEACDDGNADDSDNCLSGCVAAACGDGEVCSAANCSSGPEGGHEECDNGGQNSDSQPDACRSDCRLPGCGDGVTDPGEGEECDAGASNSDTAPDTCRTTCENPSCGDDVIDPSNGEECDGTDDAVCQAQDSACGGSCTCANECPDVGEALLFAGTGIDCTSDDDCGPGTCTNGVCKTVTRLDTGFKGLAHNADITDRVLVRAFLDCGSTFPCGECVISGLDHSPGYCRCAGEGNNRQICDEPFQPDADDCGGGICNCYLGPPLALSAGNVPACVVNRIREDIVGTANVDEGSGSADARLASIVHLGLNLVEPCPVCIGDVAPGDLVRDGTCDLGVNAGESCDGDAFNSTFPAFPLPRGGFHSLDCFPDPGKNVSGTGLRIDLTQSTGERVLGPPAVPCGVPPFAFGECHCGSCANDRAFTCTGDQDCVDAGVGGACTVAGLSSPTVFQDDCGEQGCTDLGDGIFGECLGRTPVKLCDGILRADGRGFLTCSSNADCTASGLPGGACSLSEQPGCFLDEIIARGMAHPRAPISAATFCIPRTTNAGINIAAGLEGPGRVVTQLEGRTFCASDQTREYVPGVGGCD